MSNRHLSKHTREPREQAVQPSLADGFAGQSVVELPVSVLNEALKNVLFASLYPAAVGWFPNAMYHYRSRPEGCYSNILIYCVQGFGWFEVAGRRERLGPGEALFLPKDVPHAYGASPQDPWSIHWSHFNGHDGLHFLACLPPGVYKVALKPKSGRELSRLFRHCEQLFLDGYSTSHLVHLSCCLRYMLSLILNLNSGYAQPNPSHHSQSISAVIDAMRHNLTGKLLLDDLARQAGLSKSRLSAIFKAHTGFSVMDYYAQMRIQTACQLLNNTSLNIKQISAELGFEDQYYFSRVFNKIMGMPPSAYRSRVRG